MDIEGSAVRVSASDSMVLSSGSSEGGIVIATDATAGGAVDVSGSGGVRVGANVAVVEVTGGSVEISGVSSGDQQGRVAVSSGTTEVVSADGVVIESGAAADAGTGVGTVARNSSMVLESGATTAVFVLESARKVPAAWR